MKKVFIQASSEPCVHCGSFYNQLSCHGGAQRDGTPVNLAFHVSCRKCRACGPIALSADEAVKAWEHRAAPIQNEPAPALLPDIAFEGEDEETAGNKPDDDTLLPH